jgi:hypothetical protein
LAVSANLKLGSDKEGEEESLGCMKCFATKHEFDLEEPHKEMNTMSVRFELARKEECDE